MIFQTLRKIRLVVELIGFNKFLTVEADLDKIKRIRIQAGAELCQAQHSLELATLQLGLLTQPAMAGPGCFAEMQLSIYWHGGDGWVDEMQNQASLSKL